ncbi:MAG: relaxase/mobilization nuclease domain-containing protein [Lachnospiraceae bacterium]|nr:relaxase/mobilization nuclease domain-containing protein [Lachnospiraceae bacterium]
MAITKIMCMKSAEHGNVSAHLKHSIAYICNEGKTENGSLVGGINCLPDFAYEQMIGTKEMFGQTGGRQGYHFIISLKPGEGTKAQMYEITRRFAEEFLGGEYEGVFSVHTDKDHLHGHLVFNSVNMVTGRKYTYKKGDWKNVIQPITNRLCEEYGLSIVAAEYSKDPVNMNRKQWEKEQSWGDFITGDMQYCRNKAESFEEFVFLMEKLGYEVKIGAHISVKAEGMRRSRRLDTLDEEFSVQNLQTYYEQERPYKYVEPPVYHSGYALHKKPANAFQQRYYGKLYRMCVVQKCRFQYKYTRYQQDLVRMKELQEEYLFLNREGINGWEDVFRAKQTAEQKIVDIDAKKKELYKEHARYKYQYEKDGDVTVYLYHEAHYREQLAELKERRKEAKRECATINRCISESTFAHMEIPLDVDVENLYMVDVPEFEGSDILYVESEVYDEVEVYEAVKSKLDIEVDEAEQIDVADVLPEVEVAERELAATEVLQEEGDVISEQELNYGVNESETVTKLYEPIEEYIEGVDEAYTDLQNFATPDMTKERYEVLTDKEKVEWLGIAECSVQDAIQRFISKLDSIGVVYRYSDDMLDEFMRLELVVAQIKREEKEAEKEQDKKIEPKSRCL